MRQPVLLAVVTCCLACSEPVAPPPAAPAAPPAPVVAFEVRVPDPFERNAEASEHVALEDLFHGTNRALCKALAGGDADAIAALLTPDFAGRAVAPEPDAELGEARIRTARFPADAAVLDGPAFARRLTALTSDMPRVDRCKLKPFEFKLAAAHDWAWSKVSFVVDGQGVAGQRLTRRGAWFVEYVADAEGAWRLRKADIPGLDQVEARGAGFTDISRAVGVGLFRDDTTHRAVTELTDQGGLETIGGLAVLDWNRDGRDDLLAWNRMRVMALFVNDGQGGFERRTDVLDPADVGLFAVTVDLDGDGNEELITTEVVGCRNGKAAMPIFTRRGERLARAGDLSFSLPCGNHRAMLYQHITPHDIDGDGDLDLLVSGYGSETSRGDFNKFDSTEGTANLLFVNQGGLVFTEEAAARGLDGTRMTYVTTFVDLDEDGHDDALVVNDFGPNEVFRGDGAGHFSRTAFPPLTDIGQSMGVTVSDFDDDGKLDVYVSNMQSSAGNRIVPLFEGELKPETYRTLLRMAAGNTLYLRRGSGRFEEAAGPTGVAGANWAWGQAYVDLDNDGDRDLYVLNGQTSNSTEKDADL